MRELRRDSTPFLHVCFSVCVPFTRVQRDIYAESKGFSRRERKGRKAHAAQSTCLRSLTR